MSEATAFATPIAFFIFNRPETTARVFAAIRQLRPAQLFIVADGPRPTRAGEAERVAATRAVVAEVNWPCEVHHNYAAQNMGLADRVASGISWVFEQVETAIILEDDCLPHPSFFSYCSELLEYYRHDERIMMVSGVCIEPGARTEASYSFSHYMLVWGWATWRRAWQLYDHDMGQWPRVRDENWLVDLLDSAEEARFWEPPMEAVYRRQEDYWGRRWLLACWLQRGLVVQPRVNLVTNIGHGQAATHTTVDSPFAELPVAAMSFPLRHPPFVVRDKQADALIFRQFFKPSLLLRAGNKLRRIVRRYLLERGR
jgi:hypothetical protein